MQTANIITEKLVKDYITIICFLPRCNVKNKKGYYNYLFALLRAILFANASIINKIVRSLICQTFVLLFFDVSKTNLLATCPLRTRVDFRFAVDRTS